MKHSIRIACLILLGSLLLTSCTRYAESKPDKIVIEGGNLQCVPPGTVLPEKLAIEVLGEQQKGLLGGKGSRNPVQDVEVTFSIAGGNTNIWFPEGNKAVTDAGGRVSLPVAVGDTLGDLYIKASFTRDDGSEKSATFRIISGLEIFGNKQEVLSSHTSKSPLGVKVYDRNSKPIQGADVYFHVEGGSKVAKLSKSHVKTDEKGIAEVFVTAGKDTKSIKISAEVVNGDKHVSYRGITFEIMGLNQTKLLVTLLGGLAIFIFGMKVMSEGLQRVAGPRLKNILQFFTRNRIIGVMIGATVTGLIQSSSACTVMVVGFVNAGLLSLQQSVGIVFGSNIGTTITAQIIAFKLHNLALPAVTIGLAIQMISKKNTPKFWGQVLMGFGLLFLGMSMMSSTLKPLRTSPTFISFFQGFDCSPINGIMPLTAVLWAVFIGTATTVIVQSSSATVGLVIALAGSGLLNFYTAVPVVLGDNIGTTITANLAAIGGTRTARRTALVHTLFNVIGTMVMIALFYVPYKKQPVFLYFIDLITPGNVFSGHPENITRHIANAHSIFNVMCVIILLPFTTVLSWIATKLVPIKESEKKQQLVYLEPHLLRTPSIAIVQAARELAYMTRRSMKMVEDAYKCLRENTLQWEQDVNRREEIVDDLQEKISNYLAKLTAQPLTEEEAEVVPVLMHAVHDAERIGDLATNILKLAERRIERRTVLSPLSIDDLDEMFQLVDTQCNLVFEGLNEANPDVAQLCLANEEKLNSLRRRFANKHTKYIDAEAASARETVLVLDAISMFERIGDHLANMAERIPTIVKFEPQSPE
jgi:Na/Pi-cotransporter